MRLHVYTPRRKSGECKKWSALACHDIKELTHDVNAPLLEFLANYIGEDDADCINYFRSGEPFRASLEAYMLS